MNTKINFIIGIENSNLSLSRTRKKKLKKIILLLKKSELALLLAPCCNRV